MIISFLVLQLAKIYPADNQTNTIFQRSNDYLTSIINLTMKFIYSLFLCLTLSNILQAQSANSSLEFLKIAPENTFSSKLNALTLSDNFLKTKEKDSNNGLFMDGILSAGIALTNYNFSTDQPQPSAFVVFSPDVITENSFRIGNKWYFNNEAGLKYGIQIVWARIGFIAPLGGGISGSFFPISYRLAPLSIGSTNFIKFKEHTGLELNLNAGLNINFAHRPANGFFLNAANLVQFGVLVNPSIKFRFKQLAIGLDLQYIHSVPGTIYSSDGSESLYNYNVNTVLVGATIGYKF